MYILGTFQINFSDFVIGGAMKGVESRVWKVSNGGAASGGKFGNMCSDIESMYNCTYYLANPKYNFILLVRYFI